MDALLMDLISIAIALVSFIVFYLAIDAIDRI